MTRALLLTIVLAAGAGCSEDPFPLQVTFPEAAGLKPGDNVVIRGLAVGQVTDLDIEGQGVVVRVEIKPRYRKHLDERATFRIEDEKLVTGKKMLVVEPGGGAPLRAQAKVAGEPPAAGPLERAEAALTRTVDRAKEQAGDLGRALLNPDQRPPRAVGGTVDLDRPGRHRVRVEAVRVEATNAAGDDWEGPGGDQPDLLLQVWVGSRQVLLLGPVEDTLEARFQDARSEPFEVGSAPVRIKVLDVDVGQNDEIGIVELNPTGADLGRTFRLAAGRVAELRLTLESAD